MQEQERGIRGRACHADAMHVAVNYTASKDRRRIRSWRDCCAFRSLETERSPWDTRNVGRLGNVVWHWEYLMTLDGRQIACRSRQGGSKWTFLEVLCDHSGMTKFSRHRTIALNHCMSFDTLTWKGVQKMWLEWEEWRSDHTIW